MQLKVVDFTEWLGNGRPPWAAYHALISGRLIALDKQTGVKLVRVVETWRRLMSKFILRVIGQEGKAACGMGQLAGEFEAGIEGGVHAMRLLLAQHSPEEDYGFLLIDA